MNDTNQQKESIIGYVDSIELYGIATLQHYIVVFTNRRVIFLKVDSGWMNLLGGMGIGVMYAQVKTEQFIEKLKTVEIDQLIDSKTDKLIIERSNLSDITISEWPMLFRSKIVINQSGKKYKFKLYKNRLKKFKTLLNELR